MRKFFVSLIICISIFTSSQSFASSEATNDIKNIDTSELNIFTDCVLLVEKETGDVLYEKNAYEKMYPASTTKMLTAIIVLENCYLNDTVTVSESAISAVPRGYTTAHLRAGEQFTVQELLYAMLVPSANDVANVLAEHVSGSISEFSKVMNEKAAKIGMTNSNFTNPSGVQDENLYTTAYDLSLLARYAMNNEKFREIVSTEEYTLPATSIYPNDDRVFETSNLLLDKESDKYYYEYATGVKTGFTDDAGDCLVASAKKDGVEFIAVCLKSSTTENGLREKFVDCKTLFDFAFEHYTTYYKELQEKEQKKENFLVSLFNSDENDNPLVEYPNKDIPFIRYLIGFVLIILVLIVSKKLLFGKRKKKKKK